MSSESATFAKEKLKIKNKIVKAHCYLKLTTMKLGNVIPMISAAIWHWMYCHSALQYTTFYITGESGKILLKTKVLSKENKLLKRFHYFSLA